MARIAIRNLTKIYGGADVAALAMINIAIIGGAIWIASKFGGGAGAGLGGRGFERAEAAA
jgi:hypothetical protein